MEATGRAGEPRQVPEGHAHEDSQRTLTTGPPAWPGTVQGPRLHLPLDAHLHELEQCRTY